MIDKAQRHYRTLPPVKNVKKSSWTHPQQAARRPKPPEGFQRGLFTVINDSLTSVDPMNNDRTVAAHKAIQRAKEAASSSETQQTTNAAQEEQEERRRTEVYEAAAKKNAAAIAKAFLENEQIRIHRLEEEEKQAATEAAKANIRKADPERASSILAENSTSTSSGAAEFMVVFGPS